jgi:glycosyltransferase involved in cell wall biosynthesis
MENKRKRIAIDASPLIKFHGGISYYIFHLLDELIKLRSDCDFFIYSPRKVGDFNYFSRYKNVTIKEIPYFTLLNLIWRNTAFLFFLRRDKIDIYWETLYVFPFLIPKKIKTLLTVYDFVPHLYPETVSFLYCLYHKSITRGNLHRADHRLSISVGTANRMRELFGLQEHAIVYPPRKPEIFYKERAQAEPFLRKQGLEFNNYLVTIGTLEPRKNFVRLTEIYCKTLEKYGPEKVMPLVIIGGGGWRNKKILTSFETMVKKYPTHFKVTGYIPDQELSLYLSGARRYIALSVYEGYGMPIAEARYCRTPVVSLDVPEMREAAEEDGVFLKLDTLDSELPKHMLTGEVDSGEKKPMNLNYPTNRESAEKIAAFF